MGIKSVGSNGGGAVEELKVNLVIPENSSVSLEYSDRPGCWNDSSPLENMARMKMCLCSETRTCQGIHLFH